MQWGNQKKMRKLKLQKKTYFYFKKRLNVRSGSSWRGMDVDLREDPEWPAVAQELLVPQLRAVATTEPSELTFGRA